MKLSKLLLLALYYGLFRYVPGNWGGVMRYALCKRIFKKCGKNVTIERNAYFGTGKNIEIGDFSGIGINANIPANTLIGSYVMMGPNCYIFSHNHETKDLSTPMVFQGTTEHLKTKIEDDVWIGRNVMIMPGRTIKKGSIVAAGCVVTKTFPEYSVIGGNPSVLIKSRID